MFKFELSSFLEKLIFTLKHVPTLEPLFSNPQLELIFGAIGGDMIGGVKVRVDGDIDGIDLDEAAHGELADLDDFSRIISRFLRPPSPMPLVQLSVRLLGNDWVVYIFAQSQTQPTFAIE